MKFPVFAAASLCASLVACNQDSASSNDQRETHLGDLRAAVSVPEPVASGAADGMAVGAPAGSSPAAAGGSPAVGAPMAR